MKHLSTPSVDLGDLRVLVVDDDPDSRRWLRCLLEQHHAAVETGACVADAIALLVSQRYDLVVSDIGMPDQDGYDLIRQLRSMHGAAALTPAIALTAFARDEDRHLALIAGFQVHLVKPVEPAVLLAAIAAVTRPQAAI